MFPNKIRKAKGAVSHELRCHVRDLTCRTARLLRRSGQGHGQALTVRANGHPHKPIQEQSPDEAPQRRNRFEGGQPGPALEGWGEEGF